MQIQFAEAAEQENEPRIIHFADELEVLESKPADIIITDETSDASDGQPLEIETRATEDASLTEEGFSEATDGDLIETVSISEETICFETTGFSVFGVVYTVDFSYSVNGQMYDFSLPGGEIIALSDLVEVLGIIGDTNEDEKAAFHSVEDFMKEIANVEFSDDSLVQVTQNEEDNDWTLTSLMPFDTEETLAITMKNGDVITVKVTDAQIKKTVISASVHSDRHRIAGFGIR